LTAVFSSVFQVCSPTSPSATIEGQEVFMAERDGVLTVDALQYSVEPLRLSSNVHVFNINLYAGSHLRHNLERYYCLCRDFSSLHVTTSCFTIWRKNKKTNGYAKVIPALASGGGKIDEAVRIFFFDDNMEWDGCENSPGICNLRDIATGEFVEFGEGKNGFRRDHAARHTVIHHSTEYRNVLVKANILDAMEDPEYFATIIRRFSEKDEKILVFMDVNSTIVCNDTVQGKDLAGTLLSTIYEFVEFRPRSAFELAWDSHPPVRIEKAKTLKQLVKEVTSNSHESYGAFWTEPTCWRFFRELVPRGELRWVGEDKLMTEEGIQQLFQEHLTSLQKVTTKDGIASSWFRVFESLKGHHTLVLNSFGVDTRKVILATVPNERRVLQVTVNYEMWDARDVTKFEGQFIT